MIRIEEVIDELQNIPGITVGGRMRSSIELPTGKALGCSTSMALGNTAKELVDFIIEHVGLIKEGKTCIVYPYVLMPMDDNKNDGRYMWRAGYKWTEIDLEQELADILQEEIWKEIEAESGFTRQDLDNEIIAKIKELEKQNDK